MYSITVYSMYNKMSESGKQCRTIMILLTIGDEPVSRQVVWIRISQLRTSIRYIILVVNRNFDNSNNIYLSFTILNTGFLNIFEVDR